MITLVQKLSNYELLGFRHVATFVTKSRTKLNQYIEFSKVCRMYKDCIDTANEFFLRHLKVIVFVQYCILIMIKIMIIIAITMIPNIRTSRMMEIIIKLVIIISMSIIVIITTMPNIIMMIVIIIEVMLIITKRIIVIIIIILNVKLIIMI